MCSVEAASLLTLIFFYELTICGKYLGWRCHRTRRVTDCSLAAVRFSGKVVVNAFPTHGIFSLPSVCQDRHNQAQGPLCFKAKS